MKEIIMDESTPRSAVFPPLPMPISPHPSPRTLALGDIHGCLPALEAILAAVRPKADDTLVTLGDYIDRGPDSRGVVERLLRLRRECRLVPVLGNHDQMLLAILDGRSEWLLDWLSFGGAATLASYGASAPEEIPAEHVAFLRSCLPYYETDQYIFLHGSYIAELPLEAQPPEVLFWDSLRDRLPGPHCSGKTAIVGHTSQKTGEVLDLGYLKCIDTRCYDRGWLTALEVGSGRLWQADQTGRMRAEKRGTV